MTSFSQLGKVDARGWSTATWSAPWVTQLVVAMLVATSWLSGKLLPGSSALAFLAIAAVATSAICLVVTSLLIRSASPRAHGVALSVVGSYAITLVGAVVYSLWILR